MAANHSDDEDFQSADEDGFEEDEQAIANPNIDKNMIIGKKKTEDKVDGVDKRQNKLPTLVSSELVKKQKDVESESGNSDDDEAQAERLKQRNIQLAKKFGSASLPKDIPNPVIPRGDQDDETPPAPPSTPSTKSNIPQYSWRIPTDLNSRLNSVIEANNTEEKTRSVLDRLASDSSEPKLNFLEQIVGDLNKVSITTHDSSSSSSVLPSLSGWSWGSASKLVSSNVSSVLDSVKNLTLPADQDRSSNIEAKEEQRGHNSTSSDQTKVTDSSGHSSSNNGDFFNMTVNAVEKAFGKVTERDQGGNLRLNKPLERLGSMIVDQIGQISTVSDSETKVASEKAKTIAKKDYTHDDKLD